MSVSDLLRYLFFAALACVGLIIGLKVWGNQKAEKRTVRELRVLLGPTSQFEQLYAKDAQSDLLKSMALLYHGSDELKREPGELLNKVFHGKGEAALFKNPDQEQERYYTDPRETLIRESILRNYQFCSKFGAFASADNLRRLEQGEPPEVLSGPDTGRLAAISHLIDPALSPGLERLIPNMVIVPPSEARSGDRPSDLEIKQAKTFASLLFRANLIEQSVEGRLLDHYDKLPAPAAAPVPAPAR